MNQISSLKEFNEGLSYSGGNVTEMPIIGKAITNPIGPFEEATYDIVEIIYDNDGAPVYVANFWYKAYKKIPQLIHSNLIKKYESIADSIDN